VVSEVNPLDFADVALRVDGLVTAASPSAVKLVTLSVKDFVLANNKSLSEVPASLLAVFGNLVPNFV